MLIREKLEQLEHKVLSDKACFSDRSRGRLVDEAPCPIRPSFQHDRDRILHSKPFRRLKHKTQVFIAPSGDHYRTRLTHTIEVSQIARTIAKALFLNESLTEAIALGHDLGHTPFGHSGETALDRVHPGGFRHWEQSLRVVDLLANEGEGLNLTYEVRDGILRHSKGRSSPFLGKTDEMPETMEGKVVRASDIIAYSNHDLEDALRARLIELKDVPEFCIKVLGETTSKRINKMVADLIIETQKADTDYLVMSEEVSTAVCKLRDFLFETVYNHPLIQMESEKAMKVLEELYQYFVSAPERFLEFSFKNELRFSLEDEVCDFIAGMTDRYALSVYQELFLPSPWD